MAGINAVLFPQWRDHNSLSRFPFADGASLETTGRLSLSPDMFVDAVLYPIGTTEQLYLTYIDVAQGAVTLHVGTETYPEICSTVFDPASPEDLLYLSDVYGRPAGVLVANPEALTFLQSWEYGRHTFAATAAFVATACMPMPSTGVMGLVTDDGDIMQGHVRIIGEDGIVITEDTSVDVPDGTRVIRVDVVGDPLYRRKLCEASGATVFSNQIYLQTINNVPADQYGNFQLLSGAGIAAQNALRIVTVDKGIRIELASSTAKDGK